LIKGAKKRFPNGSQALTFGGTDRTVDTVTTALQTFVDLRDAVEAARTDARAKVIAERAQEAALLVLIGEFVKFLRAAFGADANALADFGLKPPKAHTPMTAEAKAVAAAKREATRKARGITTKKERMATKGNVTAKLVVTPVVGAEPTPVAAPAPTAAPARNG
jgi:hypothetical protein